MPVLTPDDLWSIPRVGTPSCDRSGRVVVVPVTTHDGDDPVTRLWLLTDDEPRPLTSPERSSSAPVVSPDGERVAFVREVDDRGQLHVLRLDGGEAEAVTDLPLGVAGSARWLPDGSGLVFVARLDRDDPTREGTRAALDAREERQWDAHVTELREYRHWHTWLTEPEVFHVHLVDLASGVVRDLTPDADHRIGWWPTEDPGSHVDVSGDGLVAWCGREIRDGARQQLWVVPIDEPSAARSLTPETTTSVSSPRFLPDGRVVVAVPERSHPYAAPRDLVAIDPADGSRQVVLDARAWDHNPHTHAVDAAGRLVVSGEDRGRGFLVRVDVATGEVTELPRDRSLAGGVPAGDAVLGVRSGIDLPPEVVRVDDDGVTPLTRFTHEVVGGLDLGRVEERTVVGGDDDEVQVLLLHPPEEVAGDGTPSLVHLVHGGPHGTFGDVWHWRWCAAAVAARGHLVAMVNFHGSTSFGHDFTLSIHGDWATLPTQDVEAATDLLVEEGLVDPERMAIAGGSYGGYLTTWLAGQTDRYACAVAHAAVTDHTGMWASDVTEDLEHAQGGRVWDQPESLLATSPSAHYADYVTPTLVVHGQQDHRVPIDQGLSLYGVLKAKGVEARLVHYPGEHHWVLGKHNSLHWYGEVLGWLDRFLSPAPD